MICIMKLTLKNLTELLKKAEMAHAAHKEKVGGPHKNWQGWYAKFIISKLSGS